MKNKILIVVGGLPRFNHQTIRSLKEKVIDPLKSIYDISISISISSYREFLNKWKIIDFEIPILISETPNIKSISNTVFEKSCHPFLSQSYYYQYYNLYNSFKNSNNFQCKFDFIIKTRLDIIYNNLFPLSLDTTSINVPAIEFHTSIPFDTNKFCNDQILYGNYKLMSDYFDMIYNLDFSEKGVDYGIELLLKKYLDYKNISIKTFDNFIYKRHPDLAP